MIIVESGLKCSKGRGMESVVKENQSLREVLVRAKHLLINKHSLEEVRELITNAIDSLPYRDPKTGEEYVHAGRSEA